MIYHKANIKNIFVSPYPTASKRKGSVGEVFFLKEGKWISKYENDTKTNWIF